MKNIKNKKFISILTFILSIISLILVFKMTYISLIISFILIILSIIFSRNNKILLYLTIVINIVVFIISGIHIYKNYKDSIDVFEEKNLLLGSWIYNENGGTYLFTSDYKYIQYTNEDKTNNYCEGTYKYNYGFSNEDITIRQDDLYYYYTLTLNEEKCYIMNKEYFDAYQKIMYFGIPKSGDLEITIMNAENNNLFTLIKDEKK